MCQKALDTSTVRYKHDYCSLWLLLRFAHHQVKQFLLWYGLGWISHSFFNLGWNGIGSNFTGWVGKGAENLSRETSSARVVAEIKRKLTKLVVGLKLNFGNDKGIYFNLKCDNDHLNVMQSQRKIEQEIQGSVPGMRSRPKMSRLRIPGQYLFAFEEKLFRPPPPSIKIDRIWARICSMQNASNSQYIFVFCMNCCWLLHIFGKRPIFTYNRRRAREP